MAKVNKSFKEIETTFANLIKSTGDVGQALDTLGKEGVLSIAFLEKEIKDFKLAFANATDPTEAKKFGDVLQILQVKQQQLVSAGLGVVEVNKKIAASHGANVQATSRLSSSFLGLARIFEVLPPEAQHLSHAFEGIVQSFEKIGHGTEDSGGKVKKFTEVLGGVGLGLAISVAAGLLITLVTGLIEASRGFSEAELAAAAFRRELEEVDRSVKEISTISDFTAQIAKLQAQIDLGKGHAADLLGDKADLQSTDTKVEAITHHINDLIERFALLKRTATFKDLGEKAKSLVEDLAAVGENVDKELLNALPDKPLAGGLREFFGETLFSEKQFVTQLSELNAKIKELSDQRQALLLGAQVKEKEIELDASEGRRQAAKKIQADFNERLNIIKEFTAKFASIKDPFPDFFTKNLPVGKVENKALRAALENSFKVLSEAARDLFQTNKIDPQTVPIEIHFKPEIVGKSALVREIEEKFGDIKKEVEDAVNKGIFEVPADFRLAPEGDGQALAEAEKRINSFVDKIEGLTGQQSAILEIDSQFLVNLDDKSARDEINKVIHRLNGIASGMHPEVHIDAEGKITIKVNKDKIVEDTVRNINEAIQQGAIDIFAGFGEALGDALSAGFNTDGLKKIELVLAGLLGTIGRELIAAGVLLLKLGDVVKSITSNPALAIALGVALVALSKVITNGLNKKREHGGLVNPGETYNVNERGQEIYKPIVGKAYKIEGGPQTFTPRMSGRIIPAWQAKALARRNGIPNLEAGGVISGPTFALIGEGSGAGAGNPEVIAPLSDLRSLIRPATAPTPSGAGGRRRAILRGRELKLLDARETKSQRR